MRPKGCLISLAALIVALIVVDRVAVLVTDSVAARVLKSDMQLRTEPSVKVHGFPFLTQVVDGDYRDVTVDATSLRTRSLSDVSASVQLHGIHVSLSNAVRQHLDNVKINSADGTLNLPFSSVQQLTPSSRLHLSDVGGALQVSGMLPGVNTTASGTATLRVDGDTVDVQVDRVRAGGVTVPTSALNFQIPIGRLPFGLKITGVQIQPDAVRVQAHASNLVISKTDLSDTTLR